MLVDRAVMADVTAEQIAGWDGELSWLAGSLGRVFSRPEPRVVFTQYVDGLLAERAERVTPDPDGVVAERPGLGCRPAVGRGPLLPGGTLG